MRCPGELYRSSERKYQGTPEDLSYPAMACQTRAPEGLHPHWCDAHIYLSAALAGWSVGLQFKGQGKYQVWFGRLLVGELDEGTASFQGAETAPEPEGT